MATMNPHKFEEVSAIFADEGLGNRFELTNLYDIGFRGDIPEEGETLEENATSKSRFVFELYGSDCFSDDTGLEADFLNGLPGVRSARYAGDDCNPDNNIKLLLQQMEGAENRKARFRTVISLILNNREHLFEGVVEGEILLTPEGDQGFGYDPVFRPAGYDCSFASMPAEEKNRISHRFMAVRRMMEFLR